MCKKLNFLVILLGFVLASSVQAATIIWVSDNKDPDSPDPVTGGPRDQVWTDLLEANGYTVDLSFSNEEGRTLDATKIEALNSADLIIVSRNISSGSYDDGSEPTQWNSISTPIILQIAHLYRSSHWRWMDSTSTNNTTADIVAVLPDHPIFAGVTFDANDQVAFITDTCSVGIGTDPGNGILIAKNSANDAVWIVEWEKGVEFYAGSGQFAGGPRMYLPTGHSGNHMDGLYNLTAEGEKIFLNAVSYMIAKGIHLKAWKPNPPDGADSVLTALLEWTAGNTAASHDVYFGTDKDAVTNADTSDTTGIYRGRTPDATYSHTPGLNPGTTYYWRVDEVEDDGITTYTGDVWSFSTPFFAAHDPNPPDGAVYVHADAALSWAAGFGAMTHDVYLGTDEADVANGTGGTFKGNQPATVYNPGGLLKETTYYWRVDEVEDDGTTKNPGPVWSFTTVPDIPISDPDLLCWWKFDEDEGTIATDWSGRDNHGTIVGDPQRVDGAIGGALEFGGGNYVIDTGAGSYLNGLDAVTFCIWIKSNVTGTDSGFLICEIPTGSDDRDIRYDAVGGDTGGTNCIKYGITTTDANPEDESPSDNQTTEWQHVAVVWSSGNELQLYLNGVLTPAPVPSEPATGTLTGYTQLMVGKSAKDEAADAGWDGMIDDVRVYSKALTEDDIKRVMRGELDLAWNPKPAKGSTPDINRATPLSWSPGDRAAQHDVYFGTDKDAVANADTSTADIYRGRQSSTNYTPDEALEWGGGPYYWRIDEYNTDGTISKGGVWSFTVADFIVIDDFEDYVGGNSPISSQIWYAWHDGLGYGIKDTPGYYGGNGTGSAVGDENTASYTEENIVNSGSQSMPCWYDNNKPDKAKYSEVKMTLTNPRDWTEHGVKALSLRFRGYPGCVGSFTEGPAGTYTMTGSGTDIWDVGPVEGPYHDEFHFAYKQLYGVGSIIAKVESVENTNDWAKAGVMIRDTLDANSVHAMMVVTPDEGVSFQRRTTAGDSSARDTQGGITAPQWIRIERDIGGNVMAFYSADGILWTQLGNKIVNMNMPIYIGLALTSTDATLTCEAVFSNVTITGNVSAQWMHQDIGIMNNDAEPMYVAVANNTGIPAVVYHDDPNAAQINTWTEWNIDLKDFADKGIVLTDVNIIAIGFGNRNNPQAGGAGKMYFDDIRLYRPRCVPDKVTLPEADFNSDCMVDFRDLDIMAVNWLAGGSALTVDLNTDGTIDFKDYAVLADMWLQQQLWPDW